MTAYFLIPAVICAFYFVRLCHLSLQISQKKRKLISVDFAKDMTLNTKYGWKILNNHILLQAYSHNYFILKIQDRLLESVEDKEKPINWYGKCFTVKCELPIGSLRVVSGDNITIRLSSSEQPLEIEYDGYYQFQRNDAAFMSFMTGLITLAIWAAFSIEPYL